MYPYTDQGSGGLWPTTQNTERAKKMPEMQKHMNDVKS